MIKQLILAAALVVPGLAYAGDPSANLSIQIVPAAPSPAPPPLGGGIACDQGPNAAAIPAPAQAAGFTRCLLNADFTSAAYANPANWLAECGYGGSAAGTTFRLIENDVVHSHVQSAPCNRAVMTTDLGSQVLLLELFQNDFANNSFDILELDWPTSAYTSPWGGPNGTGLQHAQYAEVTFRMPQASAQESGGKQFLPYAFWYNGGQPPPGTFTEVDFFEIFSNLCGINGGQAAGTCNLAVNTNLAGYSNPTPNVPVGPAYTQTGFLTTTNNGINFGFCMYTNGGIVTSSATLCAGPAPLYASDGNVDPRHGLLESWLNNDCGGIPGCNPNTIQVYIKSIKLFGCPNYWNGICTGTVITSSNEPATKFGWLSRAVRVVRTLL